MSVTRSNKVSDALLRVLLAHFERSTTVSGGGLQFDAFDFDETFEILPDAFRFRPRSAGGWRSVCCAAH